MQQIMTLLQKQLDASRRIATQQAHLPTCLLADVLTYLLTTD